jgi:hypothetical protein
VIQSLLRGDLVDPSASRGVYAVPIHLLAALGRAAKAPGGAYRREAAQATARVNGARSPAPRNTATPADAAT